MSRMRWALGAKSEYPRGRSRWAGLVAAVVSLAMVATACGASSSGSASGGTARNGQFSTQGGGTIPGSEGPGKGTSAIGSFSAAFARCMRVNGVPNFPDPNGQAGQLGQSGIDPGSSEFQAAIGGPCRSLAPPAWITSGPTREGGAS